MACETPKLVCCFQWLSFHFLSDGTLAVESGKKTLWYSKVGNKQTLFQGQVHFCNRRQCTGTERGIPWPCQAPGVFI